jgi:transcriptional regulator with XRE-family HTH domain
MEALRQFRAERNLTQAQLAELAGTFKSEISRYESGRRRPSDKVALKLEALTGIDFKVLRGLAPAQDERGPE